MIAFLEAALQNLSHYPRWLVAACVVIVAAAVIWVLTKALKWTLYLAALVVLGAVALALLSRWLS